MKLYHFAGSASAFRVRIALNFKNISYEGISIDITKGEQFAPEYLKVNPVGVVPSLSHEGRVLTESLAIIEYLDEIRPNPPLLPTDPADRARVRAIALSMACGIQPLHPGRIVNYLTKEIGAPGDKAQAWCTHWIDHGMRAVETLISADGKAGKFCHGDEVSLADTVLVPQIYVGVNRFKMDFSKSCPTAWRIYQNCMALPAFERAAPHVVAKAA